MIEWKKYMDNARDFLLKKINDMNERVSGVVSIADGVNNQLEIKVRIWDLPQGFFSLYTRNNANNTYNLVTEFEYVKPYVNSGYKMETFQADMVFVTDQNKDIVLMSDTDKKEQVKAFLIEKDNSLKSDKVLSLDRSDNLDISENIPESTKSIETEELPDLPPLVNVDTVPQPPKITIPLTAQEKAPPKPNEIQNKKELPDIPELPYDIGGYNSQFGCGENFDMDEYLKSVSKGFDSFQPFSRQRDDYSWWKIENPVQLHDLLISQGIMIRNFFNVNVMMSFFKFGFFICGVYEESNGEKLLVYGFPSSLNIDQSPFKDYSVWVKNHGGKNNVEGYWLIYYDPISCELIKWEQE